MIRDFIPADEAQLCALWRDVFGYPQARNEPGRVIAEKLRWERESGRPPGSSLLVALDGERVVGSIMFGYDGHRGWLYRVAVLAEARGRGWGRQLVSAAEDRLRALGCGKINLQLHSDNDSGARFWEALGYQREPRIDMGKPF
jgi:ribosomal protein S18 acetylase RimI-like enzyme